MTNISISIFKFSLTCFFLNLVCFVGATDVVIEPKTTFNWTSQSFIIPVHFPRSNLPQIWHNCLKHSQFYCLDSFEGEDEGHLHAIESATATGFWASLNNYEAYNKLATNADTSCRKELRWIYRKHNLYSDWEECCHRQCAMYELMGFRLMNLTPVEYTSNLLNYDDDDNNKKLNLIWSFFHRECQVNIISKLGFGPGPLKRFIYMMGPSAPRPGFPYLLKIGSEGWTLDIPYENPEDFVTYEWFKINVICKDQMWICEQNSKLE